MKKVSTVEEYIEVHSNFTEALLVLRKLLNDTELEETLKWSMPTYTINNKNVIGIGAFKHHFCLWFHNGVFISDKAQKLISAQNGKTKAMRQYRFSSINDIDESLVKYYIGEAIKNQKLGKEHKPEKKGKKPLIIPIELENVFNDNEHLKSCFEILSLTKKREFCEHISTAKQEKTKQSRLEKIIPMILSNTGLNDKYRKC